MEYIASVCCFTIMASLGAYALGTCLFALSSTSDFKTDLKLINEKAKEKENQLQTLKCISDFIKFHSNLKALSIHDSMPW